MPRNNPSLRVLSSAVTFLALSSIYTSLKLQPSFYPDEHSAAGGGVPSSKVLSPKDPSLDELTGNTLYGSVSCTPPLLPIYNRKVYHSNTTERRRIPRTIHVSMKSRCMPPDLVDAVQMWLDALPLHSLYFHDDAAVDRLFQLEWNEFPQLSHYMRCVRLKGAMKIDVWRMLLIYRYGGIYSDIDVVPNEFSETHPIEAEDQAFFVSDGWNRPTQWWFAMEARHPVAYFTIIEIFKRLSELKKIEAPRVVFVTGPEALKFGYGNAMVDWDKDGMSVFDENVVHACKFNKTARKVPNKNSRHVGTINMDEAVMWNATLNVTRRQRIEWQHGVKHWSYQQDKEEGRFEGACLDYLYELENNLREQ
jgi:hypothetical protein